MANVFDYIKWRGDLSFEQSPLNEIDALIFCELSYIFFEGIVPKDLDEGYVTLAEAAEVFFERNAGMDEIRLGELVPKEIVPLFKIAAASKRFANIPLAHFVNVIDDETVEQFSAISFFPDSDSVFIAYRGTDDSITGWREDFRMAFQTPVPAQKRAEDYLIKASEGAKTICVAGHSKGGNLALWAAMNSPDEIAERIDKIYNFDGPGFLNDIWEGANYERIADKISTVIPTGSIVGLLLKYDKNYRVTKSSAKNYLYQHDALTWEVEGVEFVCDEDVAPDVKRANEVVGKWIYSMEPDDRRAFVEGFFDILCSTSAKTVTDLAENRSAVIKAFSNIEPETKQALMAGVKFFLGEGKSAITESIRDLLKKKSDDEPSDAKQPKTETIKPVTRKVIKKVKKAPIHKSASPKRRHTAISRMQKEALYKARKIIKR
ncbi:MAG: DUF2974 domain-containing protein [Clostridia bacterium]|nr:DUF2974 domain-containing protein [Clostridia bacterium]